MKTELLLDRLNKNGRLLESRKLPSRCFTKGLMELLYLAHAHITSGSPYTMTDIAGARINMDSEVSDVDESRRHYKPNLTIGSPPGACQVVYGTGCYNNFHPMESFLLGEHAGIQVGGGTTAVTPTDYQLETRFGHGIDIADVGDVTLESYTAGDDANREIQGNWWAAQSFCHREQAKLFSVRLLLYREGLPGTVTVDIYPAYRGDDDGYIPFGSPIVTLTTDGNTLTTDSGGEWREITLPQPIEIVPCMEYSIVVHCGGDNYNSVHWRLDDTSATYERGCYAFSSTGGGTWSPYYIDKDLMFECIGRHYGQLQYGGCELVNLAFSHPNGQFTIRRYFNNNSGQSRTINEVGIYAVGGQYDIYRRYTYCFLIARDIVSPGIELADGELLRVTYVPQITV